MAGGGEVVEAEGVLKEAYVSARLTGDGSVGAILILEVQ